MKKFILSLLASIGLLSSCSAEDSITVLKPQEFIEHANADTTAVLLDVRTAGEFAEGHLEGAMLIDYLDSDKFDEEIKRLDKNKTYYIYCRSGRRSNNAAQKMQRQGFRVFDMEGGITNWQRQGLPVIK